MTKLSKSLSIHGLAAMAALALVSTSGSAAISPDDTTAISSSVSTAISGASASGPSALTDAIKAAAETALKQYGAADALEVATQIIADSLADGATPQEVGQAMAEVALELGAPFSTDIADAVGGSSDSETLAAFDTAVAASTGGADLAAEADAYAKRKQPRGPLGIGGVTVGGGVNGAGVGPEGNGCINPSCT